MFFMFNLCTVQTLSGICLTLSVLTYALRCLVSCVFLLYYMYFNIFVTSESIYIVMIVMKKIPFNDVCYQGPCKGCGPWHAKGFSWFMIASIHSIRNRKSETRWKVTEDSRLKEKSGWLVKKSEEKEKKSCSKYYPLHLWSYQQLIWLYVTIMSRTSFRVNLHSIVCLNVQELLAQSRRHIWSLIDSNEIGTHNHLVRKWTLNHLIISNTQLLYSFTN